MGDEALGDLLHEVTMLIGLATRAREGSGDLSYSRMRILGMLEELQPTTQHRLAQALLISDAAVSRMLKQLAADQLVTIEIDPTHARRRLVRLSDVGATAFNSSSAHYGNEFKTILVAAGFPYERYLSDTVNLRDGMRQFLGLDREPAERARLGEHST